MIFPQVLKGTTPNIYPYKLPLLEIIQKQVNSTIK